MCTTFCRVLHLRTTLAADATGQKGDTGIATKRWSFERPDTFRIAKDYAYVRRFGSAFVENLQMGAVIAFKVGQNDSAKLTTLVTAGGVDRYLVERYAGGDI